MKYTKYALLFLVLCVFAYYFGSKSSYMQQATMYEYSQQTGVENEISKQVEEQEHQQYLRDSINEKSSSSFDK